MHSIGSIAAVASSDGRGGISSQLPWGWFSLMAIVDVVLVAVVVARKLRANAAAGAVGPEPAERDALVLRSGWWVPSSRVLGLPLDRTSYAWPLHREYLVGRLL